MPEINLRDENILEIQKGKVLSWASCAPSDQKLAFLQSFLLCLTDVELSACLVLMNKYKENYGKSSSASSACASNALVTTVNVTREASECHPLHPTNRRSSLKTAQVAVGITEISSQSNPQTKLSTQRGTISCGGKKSSPKPSELKEWFPDSPSLPDGSDSSQSSSRVTGEKLSDIREFIKSCIGSSWLIEENVGQLSSPETGSLYPEGFEVVLAFRIDDTKTILGTEASSDTSPSSKNSKSPESNDATRKRKREMQKSVIANSSNANILSSSSTCQQGSAIMENCELTIPTPCLPSPPSKKSKKTEKSTLSKVASPGIIPVHVGLRKVKLEKDFFLPKTKPEPLNTY